MANSDYRLIYTRDDGGISILCPSDNCGLTLDQIKLIELDIEFQKALETSSSTTDIVNKKQALRDAPADSAIAAASNVAELKAQWNTSILGTSPYS